jgi:hypothetical protein
VLTFPNVFYSNCYVLAGIVHLWRNDAISTVRAAALLSLEHIGGPEAAEAMHLTKVGVGAAQSSYMWLSLGIGADV